MATELMARLVSGYGKEAERKVDKDPITRDLLGGCPVMDMVMDAKDLDLALAVGSASASASASSRDKPRDRHNTNTMLPGKMFPRSNSSNGNPLQDLNLPPTAISLQIPDSSPRTSYVAAAASNINYQSVCTIEKVKFALERMGRECQSKSHAPSEGSPSPSPSQSPSPSSSSITSNSPIKRPIDTVVDGCESSVASVGGASSNSNSNSMMAAACPKCLLYVLISKDNPRCPQCNSHVPPAVLSKNNKSNKKPRINLNSTTLDLF